MPEIDELFEKYGTDKGCYASIYHALFKRIRLQIRKVVEVGIGTLIPDAKSSMVGWGAPTYRPGGSLRAWRDYFPGAEIHGIDVQPDTQLVGEPRIHTHFCDSTETEATRQLVVELGLGSCDVVIDDGSHVDTDQVATLRNLFPLVHSGGFYIVEDVLPRTLLSDYRDVVDEVVGSDLMFANNDENLFVVSRRG
jgi:hypothetical protein